MVPVLLLKGHLLPPLVRLTPLSSPPPLPTASRGVKRFLDEGGKKKIYLAQDTLLDREVAFALIKSEGLDEVYGTRITCEAKPWEGSAPCFGN